MKRICLGTIFPYAGLVRGRDQEGKRQLFVSQVRYAYYKLWKGRYLGSIRQVDEVYTVSDERRRDCGSGSLLQFTGVGVLRQFADSDSLREDRKILYFAWMKGVENPGVEKNRKFRYWTIVLV